MTVAIFATLRGAWYVLCFALPEMLAVGLAFLFYGRHANDQERIILADGDLLVELVEAGVARQTRLNGRLLTVEMPGMYGGMVRLHCGEELARELSTGAAQTTARRDERRIEVGRFVAQPARRKFARELQIALGTIRSESLGADKQNSYLGF